MSFIASSQGTGYEPGYFLAHEECTRETREMSQDSATTTENGAKYIPMGTIFPTNDGSAIGIVYEDVDVTTGNMPGSVVTAGTVYEDRLAITGQTYEAVTPESGDNPAEKGWYEKDGDVYTKTTDTTVTEGTTYYEVTGVARMSASAKTALQALGFKFVTEPTTTRPDFD